MIDKNKARELVEQYLKDTHQHMHDELIILDDETMEREFGWVFFYTSRKFLETGNILYGLVGNAPIIVDRNQGALHVTGTARPIEEYIQEFEKRKRN